MYYKSTNNWKIRFGAICKAHSRDWAWFKKSTEHEMTWLINSARPNLIFLRLHLLIRKRVPAKLWHNKQYIQLRDCLAGWSREKTRSMNGGRPNLIFPLFCSTKPYFSIVSGFVVGHFAHFGLLPPVVPAKMAILQAMPWSKVQTSEALPIVKWKMGSSSSRR